MENAKISFKIVHNLITGKKIQEHLDNLHDVMIDWLTLDVGSRDSEYQDSITVTYQSIREMLIKLKPIEKEYDLYWEMRNSGTSQENKFFEDFDYKKMYEESQEKIKELEKANARLRGLLN